MCIQISFREDDELKISKNQAEPDEIRTEAYLNIFYLSNASKAASEKMKNLNHLIPSSDEFKFKLDEKFHDQVDNAIHIMPPIP